MQSNTTVLKRLKNYIWKIQKQHVNKDNLKVTHSIHRPHTGESWYILFLDLGELTFQK